VSQELYFRLPGRARSLAATLQGLYLRWWRYGPGSERLAQAALDRVRVCYVVSTCLTEDTARTLIGRVRDRLGDVDVVLDEVAELPREANGKIRSVICAIPPAEREAVLRAPA
jgi:hypothetical protein